MSKQTIGVGTVANDGTGDPLRTAFGKVNANDTELYKVAHPGYVANNWYVPILPGAGYNTGTAQTTNTIHIAPGYIADKITLNSLGCKITTLSGGGNLQLAIYAHSVATGRPTGNALASTASITTASAASVNAAISVQLDIGWYWWAINVDNSVVCVSSVTANNQALSAYIGTATQGNALTSSATLCSLNFAQTYGTWPDLTGQTFTESTGSNLAPIAQFKVASIP